MARSPSEDSLLAETLSWGSQSDHQDIDTVAHKEVGAIVTIEEEVTDILLNAFCEGGCDRAEHMPRCHVLSEVTS